MNALFQSIGWMSPFWLLPALVLAWLYRFKSTHGDRVRAPFTEQPIRVAGESTRNRADELFDDAFTDLLTIILIGPLAGWVFTQASAPHRTIVFVIGFIGTAIVVGVLMLRVRKKLEESWRYRLGAKGEQVVGRELDQLMMQGYRVFHDMPFVGWNIDHVVIGPRGVFAVETKAWRKPPKSAALKAEVVFDGEALYLPGKKQPHQKAILEAKRNAESLTRWIAKVVQEQVPVIPVVALPGWSLAIKRYGEVAVYSATNMSDHLPKRGRTLLTPEQIQRIAVQVENQCKVDAIPIHPL